MPAALASFILLPALFEFTFRMFGLPLPSSVCGFVVLLVLLIAKGGPSPALTSFAGNMLRWLPLVFVPPLVAVMANATILKAQWIAIFAGIVAGTIASLVVTGVAMTRILAREVEPPAEVETPFAPQNGVVHAITATMPFVYDEPAAPHLPLPRLPPARFQSAAQPAHAEGTLQARPASLVAE